MAVLLIPHVLVDVAALQQLLMGAEIVDGASLITTMESHSTSIDKRARWTAPYVPWHALQVCIDDGLALGIERARGLVENQYRRIDEERARERQPLALPPERLLPPSRMGVS